MDMLRSIENAIERCTNEVETIALASQRQARTDLKPGATVPNYYRYEAVGDLPAAKKSAAIEKCYRTICETIDKEAKSIDRKMSAPASADDVATVQLALSRKSISCNELVSLYDRYGDNYQLAKAIEERAHQDGIDFPYTALVMDVEAAKRTALAIYGSYERDALVGATSLLAESVVDAFNHTDAFGHSY